MHELACVSKSTLSLTHCDSCCYLVDKKAGKFKEWLDCASLIDMKPNTPVMDVFSYLAYETVGQVRNESVFHCS